MSYNKFESGLRFMFEYDPKKLVLLNDARSISVMESVKLVRSWYGDTISLSDIKIGLDKWFMDRNSINGLSSLKILLNDYSTLIHANDVLFIDKFLNSKGKTIVLDDVSFSNTTITVSYYEDSEHYGIGLPIDDVINWLESL